MVFTELASGAQIAAQIAMQLSSHGNMESRVAERVATELAGTNPNPNNALIIDAPFKASLFDVDGRMNIGSYKTDFLVADAPEAKRNVVPLSTDIFMSGKRFLFVNGADGLPYSMGSAHSEHGVLGAGGEIVDFATISGIQIKEIRDENKQVIGFSYELPGLTRAEIKKLVPENPRDNNHYGVVLDTFSENAANTLGINYEYGLGVNGNPEIQASYFNATPGSTGDRLLTVELHQVIADVTELNTNETSGIAVVDNGAVSMLPPMDGWKSIEYKGPKSWVLTDSNNDSYSLANKSWQKIDVAPEAVAPAIEIPAYLKAMTVKDLNPEIKTYADISKILEVKEEDVTSGAYSQAVKDLYPDAFGKDVKPVVFTQPSSTDKGFEVYGYRPVIGIKWGTGDSDASKAVSMISVINEDGSTDLLISYLMKIGNGKDEVTLMSSSIPRISEIKDKKFLVSAINYYLKPSDPSIPVPVEFNGIDGCVKYMKVFNSTQEFCERYLSSKEYLDILNLVKTNSWAKLFDMLNRTPVIISRIGVK